MSQYFFLSPSVRRKVLSKKRRVIFGDLRDGLS